MRRSRRWPSACICTAGSSPRRRSGSRAPSTSASPTRRRRSSSGSTPTPSSRRRCWHECCRISRSPRRRRRRPAAAEERIRLDRADAGDGDVLRRRVQAGRPERLRRGHRASGATVAYRRSILLDLRGSGGGRERRGRRRHRAGWPARLPDRVRPSHQRLHRRAARPRPAARTAHALGTWPVPHDRPQPLRDLAAAGTTRHVDAALGVIRHVPEAHPDPVRVRRAGDDARPLEHASVARGRGGGRDPARCATAADGARPDLVPASRPRRVRARLPHLPADRDLLRARDAAVALADPGRCPSTGRCHCGGRPTHPCLGGARVRCRLLPQPARCIAGGRGPRQR